MKGPQNFFSIIFACLSLTVPGFAQGVALPPSKNGPVKSAQPNAATELSKAIAKSGIRTCKSLSDRSLNFIVGNASSSSGLLFVAPQETNSRVFSTSLAVENEDLTTYASATFATYGIIGCGMAVDLVTYWPDDCGSVAAVIENQLRAVRENREGSNGLLGSRIVVLDGGPNMRIFLLPAGFGCVQIKKEIIF
jgi:hypothetical protein